jgi:hypothetical protein
MAEDIVSNLGFVTSGLKASIIFVTLSGKYRDIS